MGKVALDVCVDGLCTHNLEGTDHGAPSPCGGTFEG